ncbi:MAG: M20/M25/M40 family metallo-hydrolase, partial [Tatlockia sp.]|nr:M20/M25/M40 family metallo-hydrolase [Tatlockia sp.]
MVNQLYQLCEINSGTDNLLGLALIRQALSASFKPIADQIKELEFPEITTVNMAGESISKQCGKALFISKRPELKRRILLSGHMDTVYGAEHPFQSMTAISENEINGPGVADMKGGLIVIQHALANFEKMATAQSLGWDVLINADEEIGSPASAAFMAEIAVNYQAALVYEP